MKKYLIFGNGESPHILKWVKELVKYFDVYLISSQDVHPEIREYIPDDKIRCLGLKVSESGGNIQFFRAILPVMKMINKIDPDYVNPHYITSHGTVAALAGIFSRKKNILIQSAWGTDVLVTPFRNKIYKVITRFALKQATLATADSPSVAGIIYDLAGTETMTFPFGLERLPDAEFTDKDPDLFFSNRTLNANSNIDTVLHLFRKIVDSNDKASLIIASEGDKKEELIRLRNELKLKDQVQFTGFLTTVEQANIYRKAQFYFSVLTSDALSVSLLEAMGFGCIPIVSDLPDNRDWIQNGKNGMIINDNTNYNELLYLLSSAEKIYHANREIISNRAIFPRSMEAYNKKLMILLPMH
jgi:glycosyltransferase involved in cell wall biosynthesis